MTVMITEMVHMIITHAKYTPTIYNTAAKRMAGHTDQ